jgi:hypothetical protein
MKKIFIKSTTYFLITLLCFPALVLADTGNTENAPDPSNSSGDNGSTTDVNANSTDDTNVTGDVSASGGINDVTNDGGLQGSAGLGAGIGTTVTQGDAGTRLIGDVGVPVETYAARDTDYSVVINMSCFAQNLRSARNGLHPGGNVQGTLCFKNSRATDNQDFQKYETGNISSSAIIGGHTHTSPEGVFTYTSTFSNGDLIDDTEFRVVGGWTRPDGTTCQSRFVQNGALSHNGLGSSGSNGNMMVVNVAFPGGSVGTCGSFVSPLVLLFDEKTPKFSAIVDFPLHKNTKYTYWPEAGSNAEILAYDRNGNGKIESSSELFTNDNHDNAFEQLKELDRDRRGKRDMKISSKDRAYKKLVLWNDANGDGISQKSEMRSLKKAGVSHINLRYKLEGIRNIGNRAQWREQSSFEFVKNKKKQKGRIIDFWFHPYFGERVISSVQNK